METRTKIATLAGVGYCMIVVSFLVSIYYNVIIGWTVFYFFASFTKYVSCVWGRKSRSWG